MLHKKTHKSVPILMILRYHPHVVIKKGIVHIPLYPSLSRCRCRHFSRLPCQLPEFVRLHVIPRIIHRRKVSLSRLNEKGAESTLIYAYFMSGVIKKHFLTLTIYFFSSFMLNSAILFVLLRSETDISFIEQSIQNNITSGESSGRKCFSVYQD